MMSGSFFAVATRTLLIIALAANIGRDCGMTHGSASSVGAISGSECHEPASAAAAAAHHATAPAPQHEQSDHLHCSMLTSWALTFAHLGSTAIALIASPSDATSLAPINAPHSTSQLPEIPPPKA